MREEGEPKEKEDCCHKDEVLRASKQKDLKELKEKGCVFP
jgi:hypothetical protein